MAGSRGRGRRLLRGQGKVEEGERDRLLLHPAGLRSVLLLPGRPILHLDARVHRLVPPQVVAVLELLVAGGADVGGPARLGERFDWRTLKSHFSHSQCTLSLTFV